MTSLNTQMVEVMQSVSLTNWLQMKILNSNGMFFVGKVKFYTTQRIWYSRIFLNINFYY